MKDYKRNKISSFLPTATVFPLLLLYATPYSLNPHTPALIMPHVHEICDALARDYLQILVQYYDHRDAFCLELCAQFDGMLIVKGELVSS